MKQYKIGDTVWTAHCGTESVEKPCPICFGKKEVTLILGNGDRVVLPCEYCGHGLGTPHGIVGEYEFIAKAREMIITEVNIKLTAGGEEREYCCGGRRFDIDELFDTKEQALVKCAEVVKQREEEQTTCAEYLKANKRESFAWNAGYHLRNAAKCRREAERHESCAKLCKEKEANK